MSSSNSPSDTSVLRSQAEFFLGGAVPVATQPDNCSIRTEPQDYDVIKVLACSHTFHLLCVLEWFKSNSARRGSCPNCRCELYEPDPLPTPATTPTMDDEMEEITDDETDYLNDDEVDAHMRYMEGVMDRLADSATDLRDIQDWFEDMYEDRDEDLNPPSISATPATGRFSAYNPQQSIWDNTLPSLPPRASSPVEDPVSLDNGFAGETRALTAEQQEFKDRLEAL